MADVREASLEHDSSRLPGGFLLQALPFVILAAGAVWVLLHWGEIPQRVPIHWSFRGKPDRYSKSGPLAALMPVLMGACVSWLLLLLAAGIRRGAPRTEARQPSLRIMIAAEIFVALVCCATIVPIVTGGKYFAPVMCAIGVGTAGFAALAFVLFQRVRAREPLRNPKGWHGIFYWDREDPALLVPKRVGVGYTFNFGHPGALPAGLLVALFVGVVIAISLALR